MKAISILCFILLPFLGGAQLNQSNQPAVIKVGEVKSGVDWWLAEMEYQVVNGDSLYYIVAVNQKYPIGLTFVFGFDGKGGTVNKLYETISQVFTTDAREWVTTFKLRSEVLTISKVIKKGVVLALLQLEDGFVHFNQKQLDELFGKQQ